MVNATNNDCAGSHGSPDRVEPAWRSLLSDHVSHVKQADAAEAAKNDKLQELIDKEFGLE
ncbi:hypothetical protein ODV19_10040 [Lactobacillus amylovorus]|uniref:Uncharacterized protein n=1 Tax=Lactobacillus amylovorus TaxID=1604 RepID=A0AAW6BC88_LACAM|nr:hypothetical protein [Lactobacillus amylovorus]MDA6090266.1 hypothetical protein [Lactobacillus amylovorus]MDB6247577.1 hypothetical protein [Lactobacillus amylovorus]